METQISEESRSIMSTCPDVPSLGTIVDTISNSLLKPGVRQISYHLFYKAVVKGLESEIEKLKSRKDEVAKRTAEESLSGKLIEDEVRLWQKDVEKIINDLEVFLKGYTEKGSRIHFKEIPFPNPLSIPVVEQSDIPTVGITVNHIQFVGNITSRISQVIVDTLVNGLRYLFSFKAIVNSLNNQIESLTIVDELAGAKVDKARNDGEIINENIVAWQQEVKTIRDRADDLLRQRPSRTCFKVLQFPDPFSRFQVGRKAAHLEKYVVKLSDAGQDLLRNEVEYFPPLENIPISVTTYINFGSRIEAYAKLWEALVKDDGHPIIGIYGMTGVGKTRMMERAWEEAIGKRVFDKVMRASQSTDVINLQNMLAAYLGFHFKSVDNEVLRASKLKSLISAGKTLLIFDDVWDPIPLKKIIGISFGDGIPEGCKIVLISRRQDVCLRNNCKDPIEIRVLTNDESWYMFTSTVGIEKIQSLKDASLAEKIVKQFGNLPLLIRAVGNVLKNASENLWVKALLDLENADEDTGGIYRSLQLSFSMLPNGEMTCLFLCSLFDEDANVEIKMLIDLATGSQLLDTGRNINGLIDKLKMSSLLLHGEEYYTIKLHPLVRDMARHIGSKDPEYAFSFKRCWSPLADIPGCQTIRLLQLDLEEDDIGFPHDLVFPNLHTLWLQCNNHIQQYLVSFFAGLGNLRSLVIRSLSLSQHQLSIHNLDKLRVLILDGCNIHQAFLNSVSRNLETMCIRECSLPSQLDLPKLLGLRKLELYSGTQIVVLRNAISRLSRLEEVNIPGGFTICEEAATSISAELSKLTLLRTLLIHFDDSQSCPDEDIVPNLIEFNIHVGSKSYSSNPRYTPAGRYSRSITLEESYIYGGLMALLEKAEEVNLLGLEDFPNGFGYNNKDVFSNLKKLSIVMCNNLGHLPILHEQHDIQQEPFSYSLSIVEIIGCRGLRFMFSVAVAKLLVQMKELKVDDCSMMEAIVKADGPSDGEILTFPKLKLLMLKDLPILTSFYNDKPTTNSSSPEITEISDSSISFFSEKVEFPALEKLVINNIGNEGELWANEVLKQKYDKITTSRTEAD